MLQRAVDRGASEQGPLYTTTRTVHPVDLDATLTPAQWRWQGASLYVVECGTSNRTEQQLVRLVTSVPGILLTNFILPGRPPREVDGIAILPRGVCTI